MQVLFMLFQIDKQFTHKTAAPLRFVVPGASRTTLIAVSASRTFRAINEQFSAGILLAMQTIHLLSSCHKHLLARQRLNLALEYVLVAVRVAQMQQPDLRNLA